MDSQPILLTVKDVMETTRLGRTKVYELIRTGELPCVRIGRAVRVKREVLQIWIAAHEDHMPAVPPLPPTLRFN